MSQTTSILLFECSEAHVGASLWTVLPFLLFPTRSQSHPRKYLYDVVANARNSVDVDKMDYLQRDWSETHSCIGCACAGAMGNAGCNDGPSDACPPHFFVALSHDGVAFLVLSQPQPWHVHELEA